MKNIKNVFYLFLVIFTIAGCRKEQFEVDTTINPNAPSAALYLKNATRDQINQLGVALQSVTRSGYADFIRNSATVGREAVYSASTDNRYFTELLGSAVSSFPAIAPSTVGTNDPGGIFNSYYSSYSQTRRRALNFVTAANNTSALSSQEKFAITGFSLTIQAYVTLNLLNMQGTNGIRETFTDLAAPGDLLTPGKFGTYATGLIAVKKMVDDGLAALNSAGTVGFPFSLNNGYTANGISSIADFAKLNRAIAARIAMYQQDWSGMSTALNASFYSATGSLSAGPTFIFSTAPNDISNSLYAVPNSSGAPYVAFEPLITDAESGDTRIFGSSAKVAKRTSPRQSGAFTSTSDVVLYSSNVASASMLRNEELVLMFAEASAQTNALPAAVIAINRIRTAYGLPIYTGALSQAALITEILKQRRYSLFFEGHRWFDMRRYNLLSQIQPQGIVSGNNFVVFTTMARPDAEVQWDKLNP